MAKQVHAVLPSLCPQDGKNLEDKVQAVVMYCNGDKGDGENVLRTVYINPNDSIFSDCGCDEDCGLCPVASKLGIPLLIRKCPSEKSSGFEKADLENQTATFLMIDTRSGFAPIQFQSAVGSCLFAREDKLPLSEPHLEALWMFNAHMIETFASDPDLARCEMNTESFSKFWNDCKSGMLVNLDSKNNQEKTCWEKAENPLLVE